MHLNFVVLKETFCDSQNNECHRLWDCTSSGFRCNPNFSSSSKSSNLSRTSDIELLRVKLNRISGICQIEADCTGLTVNPPGIFKISNKDAFPNTDVEKVRLDCWRNSSVSDDLSTLKYTGFIGMFIGSERTPNTTLDKLGATLWCMDRIATC